MHRLFALGSLGLVLITVLTPEEVTAETELSRIYLRSDSLLGTIDSYNKYVKSSSLRAAGSSFSSVLTELRTNTETSLKESYGVTASKLNLSASDERMIDALNEKLEHARLNSLLDRHYASEMSYQISQLIVLEDAALEKTSDSSITSYLESTKSSLELLKNTFSNFSE